MSINTSTICLIGLHRRRYRKDLGHTVIKLKNINGSNSRKPMKKISVRSIVYAHSKIAAVADRRPTNAKELNVNDGAELGLDPPPVGPRDMVGAWPMPGLMLELGTTGPAGPPAAGARAGAGAEEVEAGTTMASFCPMEQ